MPGYVVPITVAALVAVAVGATIFITFRLHSGQGLSISWPLLFQVYLYLMSLLALLVVVGGISTLVRAGMGTALGQGFSYSSPQVYELRKPPPPVPVGQVYPPAPPEAQEPSPEEMAQARQKAWERSFREGLLNGLSLTVVGGLIWAVHRYGRRRLQREEWGWLQNLYLTALLLVFGILTLTNLPTGLFDALSYYFIEPAPGFYQRPPGENLSTGIVALPLWLYYLWGAIRLVRERPAPALDRGQA